MMMKDKTVTMKDIAKTNETHSGDECSFGSRDEHSW